MRELERVREILLVELLVEALPLRVGRPLSVKSLREDIPRWYQVHLGHKDIIVDGVRILPLATLCREVGIA